MTSKIINEKLESIIEIKHPKAVIYLKILSHAGTRIMIKI